MFPSYAVYAAEGMVVRTTRVHGCVHVRYAPSFPGSHKPTPAKWGLVQTYQGPRLRARHRARPPVSGSHHPPPATKTTQRARAQARVWFRVRACMRARARCKYMRAYMCFSHAYTRTYVRPTNVRAYPSYTRGHTHARALARQQGQQWLPHWHTIINPTLPPPGCPNRVGPAGGGMGPCTHPPGSTVACPISGAPPCSRQQQAHARGMGLVQTHQDPRLRARPRARPPVPGSHHPIPET